MGGGGAYGELTYLGTTEYTYQTEVGDSESIVLFLLEVPDMYFIRLFQQAMEHCNRSFIVVMSQ